MKNKRKPFFEFIKFILRIFIKKSEYILLGDSPKEGSIFISNHSAASGPFSYELYFPHAFRAWGTYEMFGSVKSRFNYLSIKYFHNKKKIPKFFAYIFAFVISPFSYAFYKGMQLIPSYPDARLRTTLDTSLDELKKEKSVLIFPENSDDGYHKILKEYYAGFLVLAEQYYKTTGKDILIYNMYYIRRGKKVIVDKPVSYLSLDKNKTKKEIAEDFKNRANELYSNFLQEKKSKKNEK